MTPRAEIFLGLIALGVLAMAIGQVVAFVMATRATRRVSETLNRVEQDLRPIVANVRAMIWSVVVVPPEPFTRTLPPGM